MIVHFTVINIGIDFVSSIPVVTSFLQVVAYLLPWSNLIPLFALVIAIFIFRIMMALIRAIKNTIPFF